MKTIPLDQLKPHPNNPRLAPREDVIEQIAAQINGEFDPAHALIVRKNCEGYEIISGHHRALAARKAGLTEVPCWVREMSDEDAYMALALNNAQGELHPLEEGMHALHAKNEHHIDLKAYADRIKKNERTLHTKVKAARVVENVDIDISNAQDYWSSLAEIHSSSRWLWRAIVSRLVADSWTVETARREAQRLKDIEGPPTWTDNAAIADALVSKDLKTSDIQRFAARVEKAQKTIESGEDDAERLLKELGASLTAKRPALLSEVDAICIAVENEQAELTKIRRHADMLRTKREEEIAARNARYRRVISLEEWKELEGDARAELLAYEGAGGTFNQQSSKSIEWAQWSWNPVTGCLHNCPYCYARDLALGERLAKTEAYRHGFEPAYHPTTVSAPRNVKVPKESGTDTRYRNVFTCSMADLFGRWVPKEWIEAVLAEIRAAPQWNFLCLTKFPKRMAEFDIPANAWMGTTVDLQVRIPAAEAAFAKVKAGVRWLSVEPMLEPLKFKNLDRFDWIVIGGSSKSSQTPEWCPPFEWVEDLLIQARAAGCKVYMKTNLGMKKRLLELPFDAPIPSDNTPAPAEFNYLGKGVE